VKCRAGKIAVCTRGRMLWLAALLALAAAPALAGPNGASVVAGSATVQGQSTASVVVNQTSQNAVINWQTFNIGPGETTKILMPSATSTELDRVTGNEGPSQIFGSLTSNGQVFLVNPDGILFGPNSKVNTGSFLATTHDIANADFMAGRYNFTGAGNPSASIVNQGTITAQSGGFAALVAPGVRNTGTITAWLGQVGLASANTFALDFYGDRLIQLNVNDSIQTQVIDVSTGQPLKALVSNEGTIKANGGRVELTAVAARTVVDSVINNSGAIEADSIGAKNGMIVLEAATAADKPAGAPIQLVTVSGNLSAAGKKKGTTGGTVVVTGESVKVTGAKINASGQAGGGAVLIGGNSKSNPVANPFPPPRAGQDQGGGNQPALIVPTATTVSVDAATVINASATGAGNGGKVIVWSNAATTFYGTILAQGGAQSGNGGFVETSGGTVDFAGIRVDTTAPAGKTGTWLVDPTDLIVDATAAGTINTDLQTTNVTLQTTASGAPTGPAGTTGNTNASGNGDIIVNAALSWTTASVLTLNAYHAITIDAPITIAGAGGLSLTAANNPLAPAAPLISFGNGASVQYTVTGGSLSIDGQAYTLLYSMSSVQNINNNLSGNYALALPLNASGVASWIPIGTDGNGNVLNSGNGFSGAFQGLGNAITGLSIAPTSSNASNIGLFGLIGTEGVVSNLTLANASVAADPNNSTNGQSIGTLAGQNAGTISNVTVGGSNGQVNGLAIANVTAGGLVGSNGNCCLNGSPIAGASITNSSASVAVTSGGIDVQIGGLVGQNLPLSPITNSRAAGTVSSTETALSNANTSCSNSTNCDYVNVGGFVGQNFGTILTVATSGMPWPATTPAMVPTSCAAPYSCASGAVSVGSLGQGGGFAGQNDGIITYSFATGPVTGAAGVANFAGNSNGNTTTQIGGFVGNNTGQISNSFATGPVGTAGIEYLQAAGFAESNAGTILQSFAHGNVNTGDNSAAGGFVGSNSPNNSSNCPGCYVGDGDNNTAAISNAQAYGNVTVGALSVAGGFASNGGNTDHPNTSGGSFANVSASGSVTAGTAMTAGDASGNSMVGGLVGALLSNATITNSSAQNMSLTTTGANNIVGGIVGFNAGSVSGTTSSAPVSGTSSSYLGGAVGVNFGSLTGVTVGPAVGGGNLAVAGSGSSNFVGGIAGLNVGSIATSSAAVTLSSGSSSYVGGIAGVNGTYINESSITFANSSFPAGSIDPATFASATGTGFTVSIGTSTPSSAPAAPSWLNNANCNDPICGILTGGILQGTVAPTAVTYSVANATSTYGTMPILGAVTLTGVAAGATVAATVEVVSSGNSTPFVPTATTAAGTYTEEVVALSNPSYVIATSLNTNGILTINPATLTYVANTASKVYGAAIAALSGTVGGFVNSDTLASATTGTLSFTTAATSSSNVGRYAITGSGLSAANYVFVQASPNSTALSITPASVVVTALGGNSTYGSSPANPGLSATGLQNGQTVSALTGLSNSFGITDLTNAGSYTLNVAGTLSNPNYTVSSTVPGSWTVNPAPIVVTSLGGSSTYGASPANPGLSATGLQNGQTVSVLTGLSNSFGITDLSNAGSYTLNVAGTLTNPNYTVSSTNTGSWTVNPATLTYNATPESISAGAVIPALSGSVTGFVNGQTQASATTGTLTFSTTATSSSAAGSYPIDGSGLTVTNSNYASTIAEAPTNAAALTVTAAPTLASSNTNNPNAVTQQTTQFVQTANITNPAPAPAINLDLTPSTGGTGGTTGSTGGTGSGGIGGTSGGGKQGGNGAPPGTRLIDMAIKPLPPGSGMPPPGETRFSPTEVVLQFPPGMTAQQIADIGQRFGLNFASEETIGVLGRAVYTFRIGDGRAVREVIAAIEAAGINAAVQPNYRFGLSQDQNVQVASLGDPAQYIVGKLQLDAVHRITKGSHVVVALIDSKIDTEQPDLAGAVAGEFDSGCGKDAAPDPHGTGMAGAIVSHVNLLGVAPDARLLAICAFGGGGSPQSSSIKIANGLDYAINHGAKIINMSFAGPRDPTVAQELQIAREKGIVLIGAAGNDGPNSPPLYPGADPNVIAVTATDEKDRLFLGANQGNYVALAAPGVDILVPAPHAGVQFTTGTSVATANVSGVAALLMAQKPSLGPEQVRAILTSTAKHLGPKGDERKFGAGLIDPLKALRLKPLS